MRSDHTGLPHDGTWTTSTRSGASGQCLEARRTPTGADIRDSKNRTRATLTFSTATWQRFLGGINHSHYRP